MSSNPFIEIDQRKQIRKQQKALQELSDYVLVFLHQLDKAMQKPESHERGKRIASLCNVLDEVNDHVRYFELGVDFRRDNKERATKAAVKRMAKSK